MQPYAEELGIIGMPYAVTSEEHLDAVLNVPVELDNKFQNSIGYLDWEFKIEEFPIDEGDPQPPKTGDNYNLGLWITLMICSFCMIIILLIWRKKDKKETTNA